MRDGPDRQALKARRGAGMALGGLVLLLGGCSGFDNATYQVANGITNAGTRMGMPWGGMRPPSPEETLTIERVRLAAAPPNQLLPERGDVWPGPLPPRSTLANPDAAMRGIPDYEPAPGRGTSAIPPLPGGDSSSAIPPLPRTDPSAAVTPRTGPPQRGIPRGSSSPPPTLNLPTEPQTVVIPPPEPRLIPAPPRADGQVINTPTGPVVTSGGTDRIQTFNVPGGGTGTAIRDGNTTTLISPGGGVQVVPTPSR